MKKKASNELIRLCIALSIAAADGADAAAVFGKTGPDGSKTRDLLLLHKQGGNFRVVDRNDKVVACSVCGQLRDDPFSTRRFSQIVNKPTESAFDKGISESCTDAKSCHVLLRQENGCIALVKDSAQAFYAAGTPEKHSKSQALAQAIAAKPASVPLLDNTAHPANDMFHQARVGVQRIDARHDRASGPHTDMRM